MGRPSVQPARAGRARWPRSASATSHEANVSAASIPRPSSRVDMSSSSGGIATARAARERDYTRAASLGFRARAYTTLTSTERMPSDGRSPGSRSGPARAGPRRAARACPGSPFRAPRPTTPRARASVLARHRHDLGVLDAALAEQAGERRRAADAVHGLKPLYRSGRDVADGVPERRVRRLEEPRAPRGHGQAAPRAHDAPQRPHRGRHVRHEEDPEHADHGVEPAGRHGEVRACLRRGTGRAGDRHLGFRARQREQPLREVEAEDGSVRPDALRRGNGGGPATSANVEHVIAGAEVQPVDGLAANRAQNVFAGSS